MTEDYIKCLTHISTDDPSSFVKVMGNIIKDYIIHGDSAFDQAVLLKNQLQVASEETTIECVRAITFLILDSAKKLLPIEEFNKKLLSVGVKDTTSFTSLLTAWQPKISKSFKTTFQMQYRGLEWRLETVVASHILRHQRSSRAIIKINLSNQQSVILAANIPNLMRMSRIFSQALSESKCSYFRKVKRVLEHH